MQKVIIGKYVNIDQERALQVFTTLCKAWKEKHRIFADIVLPEDQYKGKVALMSDKKLVSHWMLVASLFQRGGVMAEDPFIPLWSLLLKYPEIFDPKTVVTEWNEKRLISVIEQVAPLVGKADEVKAHALRHSMEKHAKAWIYNMQTICDRFDGNILNLFDSIKKMPKTKQFEIAFSVVNNKPKRNQGIMGVRRKIFSLFIIWLQKEKIIHHFYCPIPVDFHALRVLVATEVVFLKRPKIATENTKHMGALVGREYQKADEAMRDEITIWTNGFLYRHRLSHLDLNPAIWALSREMCAVHPQNGAHFNNSKYLFPEDLQNTLRPEKFKNNVALTLCGECILEKHCSYCVPSKPFYSAGSLVQIKRVKDLPAREEHPALFEGLFAFKGAKHTRSKNLPEDIFEPKTITNKTPKKIIEEPSWQQFSLFSLDQGPTVE